MKQCFVEKEQKGRTEGGPAGLDGWVPLKKIWGEGGKMGSNDFCSG